MECKNCKDRAICYNFIPSTNEINQKNMQQAYLRTLRCRRKLFG